MADESELRPGDVDDALAAEYVLGVLPHDERAGIAARIERDAAFAARVSRWQEHFNAFNPEYEAVSPPAAVFDRIERRLFGAPAPARATSGLWGSIAFWRGFAAASLAASLFAFFRPDGAFFQSQTPVLVAELSATTGHMGLIASYDPSEGQMRIVPIAAASDNPKSLEVWLIAEDGRPQSLGLVDTADKGLIRISDPMRQRIHQGVSFAVSLEPQGGSPTGQPTGPVLASGTLRSL